VKDSQLLFDGKYEVLAKIREGGMGAIYRVRHRLLDEVRVVKVMRPGAGAEPELERRFLEEARIATRLRHPNLCAIHDFAVDERGAAYLVMEHVDGVNLAELLKSEGVPPLGLTLEIAHQALLALGYLHRKGIVHRDVAPDNLMLTQDDDGRPLVKLIDLGIARVIEGDADLTASGVFLGKPSYASPEQIGALPPGERLDSRSDLFGLGVVLYELLTGRLPFRGSSPAELLDAQRRLVPFEESDPNGRVPADVRAVVLEALELDREDRFDSADEFDRAVANLQSRYRSPRRLEIAPAAAAPTAAGEFAADAGILDLSARMGRGFPAPPAPVERVASSPVDPDPLRTMRLPPGSGRPAAPAPSLDAVPLFGAAAAASPGDALLSSPSEAAPPPPRHRERNRRTPDRPDMGVPLKRVRARRGLRVLELGAFALAALVVLAVWWSWPSRTGRVASESPPAATPRAEPATPAPLEAVAVPTPASDVSAPPLPTAAAPSAPSDEPLKQAEAASTPVPAPTSAPAPAPVEASAPRPHDDLARVVAQAVSARREADEARGRDFAPTTYGRAVARQTAADRLAARGSAGGAAALYREAAGLFARAAAVARETRGTPSRPNRSGASTAPAAPAEAPAVVPPEASRSEDAPDRGTSAPPSSDAGAETPQDAASSDGMSLETRAQAHREIVRAIGDYAWARRHRDADALARVFPSDGGRFAQDSKAATPPVVTVDVQGVDFQSATRATAAVQERLTPSDPSSATSEWATVVLDLEKRGDRWIIVSRRRL
jgi:eukaryotic-like serine/threonine-protein kinase